MIVEFLRGPRQPVLIDHAVAIDELHHRDLRHGARQGREAGIARPCSRETGRHIQPQGSRAQTFRRSDAAIGGAGIDIDGSDDVGTERGQAVDQALPLIAADDNDSK